MCDLYIPTIGLPILLKENRWTDRGNIYIAHRHMNVAIRTEATQVLFWEHVNFRYSALLFFSLAKRKCRVKFLFSCSSSITDDRTADSNRNQQHQLTEFSKAFHLKPKANGAPNDAQGFPRVGALERLDFPEPDAAVGNNAYDVKYNVRVLHCILAALFIIK